MGWLAYLIASRARAMRVCSALNTSMPALLTNREKQMVNQSTTSQPWTVTRSINVSMKTANTFECGSWNIRVKTSVMRFNSIELYTHMHTVGHIQWGAKKWHPFIITITLSTPNQSYIHKDPSVPFQWPLSGQWCPIYISASKLAAKSSSTSMACQHEPWSSQVKSSRL